MEDSGGTSLRVHLGYLFASGPAFVLVLHLFMGCAVVVRLAWNFAAGSFYARKGFV